MRKRKLKQGLAIVLTLFMTINYAGSYSDRFSIVSLADTAAIVTATSLNVRSGAGTTNPAVGKLAYGASVSIVGQTTGSDGKLWYQIQFTKNGMQTTGYVRSDYIKFQTSYQSDGDFERYLTSQGFPESYKPALRQLHGEYPNWVFTAQHTNLTWAEVISNESVVGRNLVPGTSPTSWKSMEAGAYNWETGTWPSFDSGSWVAASREIISYYMDPRNFLNEKYVFQFLRHRYNSSIHTIDGIKSMIQGTFLDNTVDVSGDHSSVTTGSGPGNSSGSQSSSSEGSPSYSGGPGVVGSSGTSGSTGPGGTGSSSGTSGSTGPGGTGSSSGTSGSTGPGGTGSSNGTSGSIGPGGTESSGTSGSVGPGVTGSSSGGTSSGSAGTGSTGNNVEPGVGPGGSSSTGTGGSSSGTGSGTAGSVGPGVSGSSGGSSGSGGTGSNVQPGVSPGSSQSSSSGKVSTQAPSSKGNSNVSLQAPGASISKKGIVRVGTAIGPGVISGPGGNTSSGTSTGPGSTGPGTVNSSSGSSYSAPIASYAEIIMNAASQSGVNPYVLTAMILQEQGTQGSRGISGTVAGYEGYYNFFNIEAYKSGSMEAVERGLWFASQSGSYERPWNSVDKAILGGAVYYGTNYVDAGQDTFYLKKFNVQGSNLYKHQYMTNVQAAASEGAKLDEAYSSQLKQMALEFKIPVYLNMPDSPCEKPDSNQSPNNKLSSMSVDGFSLSPAFSRDVTDYNLTVGSSVTSVSVRATALDSTAVITGTGNIQLQSGNTDITVQVKAQNGTICQYVIHVVRESSSSSQANGTTGPGSSSGPGVSGPGQTASQPQNSGNGTSVEMIGPGQSSSGTSSGHTGPGGSNVTIIP